MNKESLVADKVNRKKYMERNNKYFRNFDSYYERSKSITIRKFNWDLIPDPKITVKKHKHRIRKSLLRDENLSEHTTHYYQYLNNLLDSRIKIKSKFDLMEKKQNLEILG